MDREFGHLPYRLKMPGALQYIAGTYDLTMEWCFHNIEHDWDVFADKLLEDDGLRIEWFTVYCFANEDDAMMFKLRWL